MRFGTRYEFPVEKPLIVLVHIPKCAGTSLRLALEKRLGTSRVQLDYGVPPWRDRVRDFMKRMRFRRTPKRLVIGHFPIERYCLPSEAGGAGQVTPNPDYFYGAFVRHPLQRVLSLYHFFRRTRHPRNLLWAQMQREQWTLERFVLEALVVEPRPGLAGHMGSFPVGRLDFVGLAERYEDSLKLLGRLIGELAGLDAIQTNSNPEKAVQEEYAVDAALAAKHEALHPREYEIYAAAVRRFEALWNGGGSSAGR